MLPIVADATNRTGATKAYKQVVDKAGLAAGLLGNDMQDLDAYVTDKTVDGLFFMVAEEEKRIRENPVARLSSRPMWRLLRYPRFGSCWNAKLIGLFGASILRPLIL